MFLHGILSEMKSGIPENAFFVIPMILDQNDLENSFQGHNLNCAVLRANETL